VTRTQEELEDESKSDKVESEEKEFPDKQSNASTERESYMKKSLFLEQSRMRGKKRGGKKKRKKKRERENQRKLALRQDMGKMCMRKKQQRRTTTKRQTETLNPFPGLSILSRPRPHFPPRLAFFFFFD
jgi:hypothetical protein